MVQTSRTRSTSKKSRSKSRSGRSENALVTIVEMYGEQRSFLLNSKDFTAAQWKKIKGKKRIRQYMGDAAEDKLYKLYHSGDEININKKLDFKVDNFLIRVYHNYC